VLAGLLEQRNHDLETLHGAAIVACNAMSPAAVPVAPAEVEERLHTLPTCITGHGLAWHSCGGHQSSSYCPALVGRYDGLA
jgi:hypothetical protein